jgi:alkanesulfonate monooxygenase SsuD/methylene tetrahydromethanopterin reductase-like flavin-dependent oxidoreductase (luciferase family)
MFERALPPERLVPFAREIDGSAADDLWVVEDLGWSGGVSSAATALAVTSRLRVGIGVTPAPLRNPALLAMELANLARLHPGRLAAGIGHGVQQWMRQAGAAAPSPLALLEETVTAVQRLLRGETVTLHGRSVDLDGVSLVHPPAEPPPVLLGVLRPRSLALSGRIADGTILPEGFGPAHLPSALGHIGATRPHEVVVFTHLYVGDDAAAASRKAAEGSAGFMGVEPDEVFMVTGSAKEAAGRIQTLWSAGVETVVLRPIAADPLPHVLEVLNAL